MVGVVRACVAGVGLKQEPSRWELVLLLLLLHFVSSVCCSDDGDDDGHRTTIEERGAFFGVQRQQSRIFLRVRLFTLALRGGESCDQDDESRSVYPHHKAFCF